MSNSKYSLDDSICAIATALAPAALGIVRCTGKNCISLVSDCFSRPKALNSALGNTIIYGWIKNNNIPIDEVMISVFKAPKSFTGEDMVEISCHGGPGVVTAIYTLLLENGFRPAERGEFTFRSYINGKADLTKAEAVREIIESRTGESRSRAAGRLAGSLYEEIDSIKKLIIDTLAEIEVEIEYPEDEETIADSFNHNSLIEAVNRLEQLSESWLGEKVYQDGARVVLCGRTNAGKSSLFNAILKEDRAIVSDIEGTTRDWIESWVDFNGIPVRLFDTAGLRQTEDVIEAKGVELTHSLTDDADLVLYIMDSLKGFSTKDVEFLSSCTKPFIIVWNKCDLLNGEKIYSPENISSLIRFEGEVNISAKKASDLKSIYEIVKKILLHTVQTEKIQAGLGSERQKMSVDEALDSLRHALAAADDFTLDAVVQDLEEALNSLGEVTGEVSPDDVLSSIFSRFCVGK